jgi:hypothetical protein
MTREQETGQLLAEMKRIPKVNARGKRLAEYKIIEMACARLGWFPSYGFRLLQTGFQAQPEDRRKV